MTPELALALKMVPATAFLPLEHVEGCFNLVMEEVGDMFWRFKLDDAVSEKVQQFACHFHKNYIRGTSRAPLFEPSIWNQNIAASEGLARTNIAIEGWQYGIQSLFLCSHPNVQIFLQKSTKMLYSIISMSYRFWLVNKKNRGKISSLLSKFQLS